MSKEIVSLNPESLRQWQEQNLEQMRYDYDVKVGDYVLDIGSYQREWGKRFEAKGCIVEYFDALDNRAAWTYDGEIAMGGAYYYTSMFGEGVMSKFKCVDIAPYLQKEVALCKINIEGGEVELLNYIIEKGLIGNIHNLQVQFHMVEGRDSEKDYISIAGWLSRTHELSWRSPFCWESWKLKS